MSQRALTIALASLLLLGTVASFVVVDHKSCIRTSQTRSGLRIFFGDAATRSAARAQNDTGIARILDLQAVRSDQRAADAEPRTGCWGFLP